MLSGSDKHGDHCPNHWNYMNEFSVGCAETVFVVNLSLTYFFAPPSRVEFGSSGLLPPSQPCAQSKHCVCLTVWLSVAVLVWECQWLSVCHAVSRRSSLYNLRSRNSLLTLIVLTGSRTPAQVNSITILFCDYIWWYTQVKDYVVNLFYLIFTV